MNRLLSILLLVALFQNAEAVNLNLKLKKSPEPVIDYKPWISAQNWEAEIDGIQQFYPETVTVANDDGSIDSVAVVTGILPVTGLNDRQAFLAAMVYSADNFDHDAEEGFEDIDYRKQEFTVLVRTTVGTNNNEATYTRSIKFSPADGGLRFEVGNIDCRYRDKGIIPRTQRLEKLHPEKNKRHAELVKEFVEVNSQYLAQLAGYVATRPDIDSPNYARLGKGNTVTEGMNMDEVTILLGAPMNKRKSGDKYRWIYANDFVVIFTDGLVSKIVD